MEIPFLNLHRAYTECKTNFDQLWFDINCESSYILGNRLEQFEKEFSVYLGVKHVIGVANGLDALTICLKALKIGHGAEVIVPAFTFIATWLAVSETGAVPVPVDIDNNYLINSDNIKKAITSKTKAIMPVHLYGRICNMQKIITIAKEYNLKIIEDAAQAHGTFDQATGKKAGTLGDCAGFSFYPGKNLGCFGDGGCISTNDDDLAEHIRLLRNYGSKVRYEHEIQAGNSRLDDLQAGVLSIKLKCLDDWNRRRKHIAEIYLRELNGIGDLILPPHDAGHIWHIFSIRTSKRSKLMRFLTSHGIGVNVHYPKPIHLQEAYKNLNISGAFPVTEDISSTVLSLPIGPHLTEGEAFFCVQKIRAFFENESHYTH